MHFTVKPIVMIGSGTVSCISRSCSNYLRNLGKQ